MRIGKNCRFGAVRALAVLAVGGLAWGSLDGTAWRAYEAVEEAWIQERHGILVQQAPAALNASRLDMEIRLAELKRKGLRFKHIQKCDPIQSPHAVWQLAAISLGPEEEAHLGGIVDYRRIDDRIRQLNSALQRHQQYSIFRRAQTRLWKTPQYRDAHRRYTDRLQELQVMYGTPLPPSVSTVN